MTIGSRHCAAFHLSARLISGRHLERALRRFSPARCFLFKLHAPRNFIAGGGIFAYANTLPCSLAWEAFGNANGAHSLREMRARIAKCRKGDPKDRSDFQIGCRILTQPFFFAEDAWIPAPPSWSRNIVTFKTYATDSGRRLMTVLPAQAFNRSLQIRPALANRNSSSRASGKGHSAFW